MSERETVAWLILNRDGYPWGVYVDKDSADTTAAFLEGGAPVPLYRHPFAGDGGELSGLLESMVADREVPTRWKASLIRHAHRLRAALDNLTGRDDE
jgi:hypothetical protein